MIPKQFNKQNKADKKEKQTKQHLPSPPKIYD
jgi:hypothetical protein